MKHIYIILLIAMFLLYAFHPARPRQIKDAVRIWGTVKAEITENLYMTP